MRADIFVASKYPAFTRSSLELLFDRNLVEINSKPEKPSYRLKAGDKVVVDGRLLSAKPPKISLPVIYEDDDVIVIDKPEGMLTHSKGALNLEATVATFILPKINDETLSGNRAGIVHRLDRGTSGVMIGAKNTRALSKLQKQFSQRKTKKVYNAIVEGVPEQTQALIDAPIERNPKRPQTFRVGANGRSATTEYRVIRTITKKGRDYSLLELKPATGRTHQIRVHLAYIGHPVAGDHVYGQEAEHLYLHAASLEVTLPSSERKVFTAPPPKYFNEFLGNE